MYKYECTYIIPTYNISRKTAEAFFSRFSGNQQKTPITPNIILPYIYYIGELYIMTALLV